MTTTPAAEDGSPPVEGGAPLVAEDGLVPEDDMPPVADGTPSVAEDETPPLVADETPPVSEIGTLPASEDNMPLVAETCTPSVAENGSPPVDDDGTPPVAEDSAPVPVGDIPPVVEDETPPVFEIGTLPISEDDMPLVVEKDTPAVAENGLPGYQAAMLITEGGTPPVAQGDIFLGTEEGTPRASASQGPKLATWARRLRMSIAYVLLLAVLGAAGICAFALVQGSWIVTPILSGSMRPGLAVGGVAISQRVRVDSLAVRDVIVFADPYKPSEQIVHRIVRITKGSSGQLLFNTQGDANTVRDPWTMTIRGNYVYRVRWTVPLIGYIAIAYQNHRGFFLLGAGIVLILIAVSSVRGTSEGRRRRHARRASPAT
jgi:signal peptidase I